MTILPMHGLLRGLSKSVMPSAKSPLSGESFSSLLDTEEGIARILHGRTFSFSELGVFGRHGATLHRTEPVPRSDSAAADRVEEAADVAPTEAENAARSESAAAFGVGAGTSLDSNPRIGELGGPIQQRTATGSMLSEPGLMEARAQLDVTEFEASPYTRSAQALTAAFRRAAVSQLNGKTSFVNVAVSGQNGALTVLIRSGDLSQDDRTRLRRILDQIATELGLRIAAVHINGSPVPQHTLKPFAGDTDGHRAG